MNESLAERIQEIASQLADRTQNPSDQAETSQEELDGAMLEILKSIDPEVVSQLEDPLKLNRIIADYIAICEGQKRPGDGFSLKTRVTNLLTDQTESTARRNIYTQCLRVLNLVWALSASIAKDHVVEPPSTTSPMEILRTTMINLESKTLNDGHSDADLLKDLSDKERIIQQIKTYWTTILQLLKQEMPDAYQEELTRLIGLTDDWLRSAEIIQADTFLSIAPGEVDDPNMIDLVQLATYIRSTFLDNFSQDNTP